MALNTHERKSKTAAWLFKLMALCVLLIFAIGCEGEISVGKVTKKKGADAAKAAATKQEVVKPPPAEKDYVYTSIGKRDPFRSIFEDSTADTELTRTKRVLNPLQNYDINSFTVTAIVWGVSSPTAMVVSPDGMTHIVKTGTLIGRNWGKVVKIKRDSIVVLEESRLGSETKVSNLIELKLPATDLEKKLETEQTFEETEGANQEELLQELGAE